MGQLFLLVFVAWCLWPAVRGLLVVACGSWPAVSSLNYGSAGVRGFTIEVVLDFSYGFFGSFSLVCLFWVVFFFYTDNYGFWCNATIHIVLV